MTLFKEFQDFLRKYTLFKDFQGLENENAKFKDFQGFQGPVRTLHPSIYQFCKKNYTQFCSTWVFL